MKIVILEDYPSHRENLRNALLEYFPGVSIREAAGLEEARLLLSNDPPDLALLDIEMDGDRRNTFDLLQELDEQDRLCFDIIFITAYGYQEYLLQAMEYAALKYLRKPLNEKELKAAVEKAKRRKSSRETVARQIRLLLEQSRQPSQPFEVIALPLMSLDEESEIEMVKLKDIQFIETCMNGKKTQVFLKGETKPLICDYAMPDFRKKLPFPIPFFQIHESRIVNLEAAKRYNATTFKLTLHGRTEPLQASREKGGRLKYYMENGSLPNVELEDERKVWSWIWRILGK
ncbi:MAG: LytTR family DNA-binding domain-containing protein [Bacteroidota bacterium]